MKGKGGDGYRSKATSPCSAALVSLPLVPARMLIEPIQTETSADVRPRGRAPYNPLLANRALLDCLIEPQFRFSLTRRAFDVPVVTSNSSAHRNVGLIIIVTLLVHELVRD
jgi:hypothetical protein